jgi:GT2 family glycosyltransferase
MVNETKIGVVTVTYNSAEVIDGFMRSMLRQSHHNFVLYVVDNASSDATLERLANYKDKRIVVKANTGNLGVAGGNNQGIEASLEQGCDSVLIINNDTEFEAVLLERLIAGLERYACDMIVPIIFHFDTPDKISWAGGQFDRMKGYLPVGYGANEIDRGQYDRVREVEFSPTTCMLVRSSVFLQIGLMDEQYFVYYDDTDFCLRAKQAGLKLMFLPSAKLWHKESSLTGRDSLFKLHYMTRNHIYFIRKNLTFGLRLLYLPAYQLRLVFKFLFRIVDWEGFALREKAFLCGLRVTVPKAEAAVAGAAEAQTLIAKRGDVER